MSVKLPLVVGPDGRPEQLQSGDSISTGTTGQATWTPGTTLIAGNVVYISGADAVAKAQASATGTSKVAGVAAAAITGGVAGQIAYGGICTLTTAQWDAVAGTTGGLTANTDYYLSPTTAGMLTTTCPTTVGQVVVIVGTAVSSTELRVKPTEPILL